MQEDPASVKGLGKTTPNLLPTDMRHLFDGHLSHFDKGAVIAFLKEEVSELLILPISEVLGWGMYTAHVQKQFILFHLLR